MSVVERWLTSVTVTDSNTIAHKIGGVMAIGRWCATGDLMLSLDSEEASEITLRKVTVDTA